MRMVVRLVQYGVRECRQIDRERKREKDRDVTHKKGNEGRTV
jgi:hypothetical protein